MMIRVLKYGCSYYFFWYEGGLSFLRDIEFFLGGFMDFWGYEVDFDLEF
jgi:hypothetical protein